MPKKILLLSAYDALSHQHWRHRLQAMLPEFNWTQLSLPARNFSWRIRGNSLEWSYSAREILEQHYDLLIVTSMVDLSALRGFVPALGQLPTLVYFHENQFVYPPNSRQLKNAETQLVPLYTALCGQKLVFNSHYNRRTFLQGAQDLLTRLPARLPVTIMQQLQCSQVLPVPLPQQLFARPARANKNKELLDIVWNHRWEYDKGPGIFLKLLEKVTQQSLPFRFHVLGQQFRQSPSQFQAMAALLKQHYQALSLTPGHWGNIADQADYFTVLHASDIVLSTALHDFQGLALQEATAAGCTPLAPARLVYPEYLATEFLYSVNGDEEFEAEQILQRLRQWLELKKAGASLPHCELAELSQAGLKQPYRNLLLATMTAE